MVGRNRKARFRRRGGAVGVGFLTAGRDGKGRPILDRTGRKAQRDIFSRRDGTIRVNRIYIQWDEQIKDLAEREHPTISATVLPPRRPTTIPSISSRLKIIW